MKKEKPSPVTAQGPPPNNIQPNKIQPISNVNNVIKKEGSESGPLPSLPSPPTTIKSEPDGNGTPGGGTTPGGPASVGGNNAAVNGDSTPSGCDTTNTTSSPSHHPPLPPSSTGDGSGDGGNNNSNPSNGSETEDKKPPLLPPGDVKTETDPFLDTFDTKDGGKIFFY